MKENKNRLNYGCFDFPWVGLSKDEEFNALMDWLDFKEESWNDNRKERTTTFYGLSKRFRYGCLTRYMFDCYPKYQINIIRNENKDVSFEINVIK